MYSMAHSFSLSLNFLLLNPMDKSQSKELVFELSQNLRFGDNSLKIQAQLPTDIFYWKCVIELVQESYSWSILDDSLEKKSICDLKLNENVGEINSYKSGTENIDFPHNLNSYNQKNKNSDVLIILVLWIENLLKNPFELSKILSEEYIEDLRQFLIFQLNKTKNIHYRKLVLRCISIFVNHLVQRGINRSQNLEKIRVFEDIESTYCDSISAMKLNDKSTIDCKLNSIESSCENENKVLYQIQNTSYNNEYPELFYKLDGLFYILNIPVSEVDFYCFLKYLSQFRAIDRDLIKIEDTDTIQIKRYKIKIISFITERSSVKEDINVLLKFFNIDDTKLGWTIAKSIYRMSKFTDKSNLIKGFKKFLSDYSIIPNEQCWINVMTILSFFILDGESIGDFQFIEQALKYDNEFCRKRTQLKETALFLLWALLRNNKLLISSNSKSDTTCENFSPLRLFNLIIYKALFDFEFVVRRAAASVVQELVGRYDIFRNDPAIYKIIPENVKRRIKSIELFDQIFKKEQYFEFFENSLYSYDEESRNIGSILASKYLDFKKINVLYKHTIEIDGTHRLIYRLLKNLNKINDNGINQADGLESNSTIDNTDMIETKSYSTQNGFCHLNSSSMDHHDLTSSSVNLPIAHSYSKKDVISFFSPFVGKFILNSANFKFPNMNYSCISFLSIAPYFSYILNVKDNLFFLATKNFLPRNLYRASKYCFNDKVFSKKIFENFHKNQAFILMNSNNFSYREQITDMNLEFIKQKKNVDICVYALQLLEAFDLKVQNVIFQLLEDYSISYCGDSGYYNRRAALEYFCCLYETLNHQKSDNNEVQDIEGCNVESNFEDLKISNFFSNQNTDGTQVSPKKGINSIVHIEKYIIRYLCDKSRKLRDDVLKVLLSSEFSEFKNLFPFVEFDSFSFFGIRKSFKLLEIFFLTFKDLSNDFDYETAYIKTIFKVFSSQEDFFIGINNMFETADSKLLAILKIEIHQIRSKFVEWGKSKGKLLNQLENL